MSLTKTQIDALIDRNCRSNSSSYSVADKTADENLAMDFIYATIFSSGGTWQFDDSNHTDYPIITTNLVASQRDYSFVSDAQGNLILDIYKVMIKDPSGVYQEILPYDMQSESSVPTFNDGQNLTGTPTRYDKTANGIFLDKIPNYNSTNGLKIFINREGSYFLSTDTTKKPGFAGLFHEYLALKPSISYCKRNKMFDLADRYERDAMTMEQKIRDYYGKRERDTVRRLKPNIENNK